MRAEVENLKAELAKSTAMNETMTARLQEVVRALSGGGSVAEAPTEVATG